MFTDGEQQDPPRGQNSTQADGQSLDWDIFFSKEITCDASPRDWIERTKSSSTSTNRKWFVETDVAIKSNSENDQVQTTRVLDRFVVPATMQIDIAGMKLPVQKENLIGWDIDVIKQLFLKPTAMRLRAIGGQSIVFIERKQDDAR